MKTAIIISDHDKHVMFTPETKTEEKALNMITENDNIYAVTNKGRFHDLQDDVSGVDVCMSESGYLRSFNSPKSVIFTLTPKQGQKPFSINMNDYITIFPSCLGWAKIFDIHSKKNNFSGDELEKYIHKRRTECGGYRDQLWAIIRDLNEIFYNGSDYLRNTNIEI